MAGETDPDRPGLDDQGKPTSKTDAENRTVDAEVGYCRPPRRHQFPPGQSGNPDGRPRRQPRLLSPAELMVKAMSRELTVADTNGRTRKISAAEALMHQVVKRGMTDNAAAKIAIKLVEDGMREIAARPTATPAEIRHVMNNASMGTLMELRNLAATFCRTESPAPARKPPKRTR